MALLQNDKAIFYHPLNNVTEALKSQAWTGTSDFASAKVSLGLKSPSEFNAFGAETEFLSSQVTFVSIAVLNASKFIVAYRNVTNSGHGTSKVGTISGTDITFGAETEFLPANSAAFISATGLSTTKFVVAYQDGSDSFHGTAKVGTVSGTDITYGAEAEFLPGNGVDSISAAALSATKFVVMYRDNTDGSHGTAKVGTVSGTDIAFGAEAEFLSTGGTGTAGNNNISASALSASAFVVVYTDFGNVNVNDLGKAKVGTVSGTDITFGAEAVFQPDVGSTLDISVAGLSATSFVVAYRDNSDSGHGTAKAGAVAGSDITLGAETEFLSVGAADFISVAGLSATTFVVAYQDLADAKHGTAKVGTVSGTAVTFGAETEFQSNFATGGIISAAVQDSAIVPPAAATEFVVGYRDAADNGHGTAKVGTLASGASLTASTPAAYDSAAGATKVAYAGWLKNPSA